MRHIKKFTSSCKNVDYEKKLTSHKTVEYLGVLEAIQTNLRVALGKYQAC